MSLPKILDIGIYTIPEAAELVQASKSALRIWVDGRAGRQAPVIENQLGRVERKLAVSFTNLMELRFVSLFANAGVGLSEIRRIMDEARTTLEHPHPFATRTVFRTDGRKIVAEIARRNGVADIYDLRSRNYELSGIVMDSLKEDVVYDPKGDAVSWRPRPKIAPHVIVHPSYSFGRPILEASHIPTETINAAVKAEGSARVVAQLYDLPEKQVHEAVSFERNLHKAA
jgi:uncharacterized protein (DUF433 family)